MAVDLGTLLTVVELVQKAVEIYERIDGLPQQMEQLGRRMGSINRYLVRLQNFVERTPKTVLYSGQLDDLGDNLARIKELADKVYDLFDRYNKGILSRSKDLEFRVAWASRLWFSLFDNSADKVQAIIDEINEERTDLLHYMMLMGVEKLHEPRQGRRPARTTPTTPTTPALFPRRPTPTPSPAPPRRDCNILFVDPYNEGRSVAAEAVLKLLGQLTRKAHGDWRIAEVRSAGFFAKEGSDCIGVIDGLSYSEQGFKLPWWPGGQSPNRTAMAAVFDNKWCDYPFKKDVREKMAARTSRGMTKDTFAFFDFIIVFTLREHDNMVKLKQALRRKGATNGGVPRGKGKVLQLGTYLGQKKGEVREILHPNRTSDAAKNRENWNRTVSDIRTALKGFLKQEMKWEQPRGEGSDGTGKTLGAGRA